MKWMWAGLGVMFVLFGVATVFGSLYPQPPTSAGSAAFPFGFGWVWNVVGIFFLVWVFAWVFGWARPWGWRRYRWRYGYGDEYAILRERYARGEITNEQFDQMTRDLEAHEGRP